MDDALLVRVLDRVAHLDEQLQPRLHVDAVLVAVALHACDVAAHRVQIDGEERGWEISQRHDASGHDNGLGDEGTGCPLEREGSSERGRVGKVAADDLHAA